MAAVTIHSDIGAQENKVCHCFHCFPIYCHEMMGPDVMIFAFLMLSFKSDLSLVTFTFNKRLFSSCSLSAIRVVSSAYLRLSICLPCNLDSSLCFWIRSDRVSEELWTEVHDTVEEAVMKTISKKNKCKQAKWLSEEGLQIAEKRREAKGKGQKERYIPIWMQSSKE